MLQYGVELSDNLNVWYASFTSDTYKHSHLELPKIAKASLIKGKAKVTLCNLLFKNLKLVMILFKHEFFLAISIMGEEYGDISCFKIPKCTNLCISLSIIGLSSFREMV